MYVYVFPIPQRSHLDSCLGRTLTGPKEGHRPEQMEPKEVLLPLSGLSESVSSPLRPGFLDF